MTCRLPIDRFIFDHATIAAMNGDHDAASAEAEPDYRVSLAAERTYLAYLRTGLAFVAAGVALAGALPHAGAATLRRVLGVLVIAAGAAVFGHAHRRWYAVQQALRRQQPLPRSRFTQSMAWALVLVAIGAVVVALTV